MPCWIVLIKISNMWTISLATIEQDSVWSTSFWFSFAELSASNERYWPTCVITGASSTYFPNFILIVGHRSSIVVRDKWPGSDSWYVLVDWIATWTLGRFCDIHKWAIILWLVKYDLLNLRNYALCALLVVHRLFLIYANNLNLVFKDLFYN